MSTFSSWLHSRCHVNRISKQAVSWHLFPNHTGCGCSRVDTHTELEPKCRAWFKARDLWDILKYLPVGHNNARCDLDQVQRKVGNFYRVSVTCEKRSFCLLSKLAMLEGKAHHFSLEFRKQPCRSHLLFPLYRHHTCQCSHQRHYRCS